MLMSAFFVKDAIVAPPNAYDNTVIYKAQSILTNPADGVGPVLPYEQALDVVLWAERGGRIQ